MCVCVCVCVCFLIEDCVSVAVVGKTNQYNPPVSVGVVGKTRQ